MENILTVLNNIATFLREYTIIPAAVILIILAFTLIFGDKNDKIQNAKRAIGGGIAGLAIWVFLIPLAETITGFFVF